MIGTWPLPRSTSRPRAYTFRIHSHTYGEARGCLLAMLGACAVIAPASATILPSSSSMQASIAPWRNAMRAVVMAASSETNSVWTAHRFPSAVVMRSLYGM